jgi:dihydrofolate reductase
MGIVFVEITMSLDGFVAAQNVGPSSPLGEGGMRLHDWLFQSPEDSVDRQVAAEYFATTGAFVIGRLTFDLGEEPWGDDGTFGVPCFVVTHRPRPALVKGPTTFTFVTDGMESALVQAKAAAGEKDVCIMGGAAIDQQFIKAGFVDELRIHIAPVLLGAGTRLFDHIGTEPIKLEQTRLIESPLATHLRYRVVK